MGEWTVPIWRMLRSIVIAALVVAGCGGNDPADGARPSADDEPANEATDEGSGAAPTEPERSVVGVPLVLQAGPDGPVDERWATDVTCSRCAVHAFGERVYVVDKRWIDAPGTKGQLQAYASDDGRALWPGPVEISGLVQPIEGGTP